MEQEFPIKLMGWLGYIFIPSFVAVLCGFFASIQGFFLVPLYFWKLFWHPNGRLLIDMFKDPEGRGRLIPSNVRPNHRQFRQRARPISRRIVRRRKSICLTF